VGVCIDILFIADTSDDDTPIPAKVGGRGEEACSGIVVFPGTGPWRGFNENREGMASSSSFCRGVSDVELSSSSSPSSANGPSDCESSPEAEPSEPRELSLSSSLTRLCRLRGASSWRRIKSSDVRACLLFVDNIVGRKEAFEGNGCEVARGSVIGAFFDHDGPDEVFPVPPPPQTCCDDLSATAARRFISPGGLLLPSLPLYVFPAVATLVWHGLAYLCEHPIHHRRYPRAGDGTPSSVLCFFHTLNVTFGHVFILPHIRLPSGLSARRVQAKYILIPSGIHLVISIGFDGGRIPEPSLPTLLMWYPRKRRPDDRSIPQPARYPTRRN
jgi:hypothetical protein